MSILGTRVLRTEDPGFLSTGAIYTEDVQDQRLAGACYVHFVRSTVAHARINSIDVSAALDALPECFRVTVYLADVEGYPYKDIAEMTGVPVGTVMSRLHRGRARLRKQLDPAADGPQVRAS